MYLELFLGRVGPEWLYELIDAVSPLNSEAAMQVQTFDFKRGDRHQPVGMNSNPRASRLCDVLHGDFGTRYRGKPEEHSIRWTVCR